MAAAREDGLAAAAVSSEIRRGSGLQGMRGCSADDSSDFTPRTSAARASSRCWQACSSSSRAAA